MSRLDFSRVDKLVDKAIEDGLQSLGNDVKKRSQVLAPVLTGRLRQSARVDIHTNPDRAVVGFYTPYASVRERFNKLHPSTTHYLENGLKSIHSLAPYFKRTF